MKDTRDNVRLASCKRVLPAILIVSALLSTSLAVMTVEVAAQEEPLVFWVGTMMDVDSFNPFTMTSITSYAICELMFEYLLLTDINGVTAPGLADSYSMSEDGLVWTYYLAEDSYFHDGVQVTAHDVVFTFEMVMRNPQDCSMLANYLDGVIDVDLVNDFTVQLTLDEPRRGMLEIWIPILPEHQWSTIEDAGKIKQVDLTDTNYFPNGAAGSGAFVLSEHSQTQSYIKLLKWEDFNFGPVNIDELYFKIYDFEDTMVNALETGQIDIALDVPVTHWKSTLELDDIAGVAVPSIRFKDFGFNCASEEVRTSTDDKGRPNFPDASTNYETTNLSVRQACAMAVNKTLLVEEAYQNLAVEGDSLVSTATPFWHYYVPEEEELKFDIDAANELLENAGYRDIDDDGIRENVSSGVKLDFKLYYANPYTADQIIAEKVSDWLEQIGINAPPTGVSEGTLNTMWFGMEYDIFIWDWWPTLDPSWILAVLTTDEIPEDSHDLAKWSDTYYSNPYYDDLFEQQNKELDKDVRQGIVHEMQAIAYRDCPYSILCYLSTLMAYRTDDWVYPDMMLYSPRGVYFYFEILPAGGVVNLPPENVDAGPDQTADVGEELSFTGSAEDPNTGDELTWNWTFSEPDDSIGYREGKTVTYTFWNEGTVTVTLKVTDSGGLFDSDEAIVTVSEVSADAGWIRGYVKDASENPIAGATVVASNKTKSTGSDGLYNISLSPGTYSVNVTAPGYANASESASIETGIVTWLNFTLTATAGSLVGKVSDSDSEEPIQGVKVTLTQGGVKKYEKFTDSNGDYAFSSVIQGTYDISVSASGYETYSSNVTISAGETTSLDVGLVSTDDGGGSSDAAILGGAVALALIVAAVAGVVLAKRRKRDRGPEGPDGPTEGGSELPPDITQ